MLSKEQIKFFLSYQFLDNEEQINRDIDFVNAIKLRKSVSDSDCYDDVLDIIEVSVKKSLDWKNISEVWLLLSWWVDSFLLLYFLRKNFPKLKIYALTLLSEKDREKIQKLKDLSDFFWAKHICYIKDFSYGDVLYELKDIYSNGWELVWDDGYIINNFLFRNIKKDYNLEYVFTADGMDVLFWGLSQYRLSYLENKYFDVVKSEFFRDVYEERYYFENIKKYWKEFFYKFGEFFWGDHLWENWESEIESFFEYFEKVEIWDSLLKKQIYFNYVFLIQNRRKYIENSGKINGIKTISPFIDRQFVKGVFELNLDDGCLLDEKETKLIIRKIAKWVLDDNNIDFEFFDVWRINYFKIFNENKKHIQMVWLFLYKRWIIEKEYLAKLNCFVSNSMWYENKMRIYLLLNLYYYLTLALCYALTSE